MKKKLAILAAAAAIAVAAPATQSKADVDFHFGFQLPNLGHTYRHDNRNYGHDDRSHRNDRLTCREARRLVRDNGYRRVQAVECNGRVYVFNARRHGDAYRVRVNARHGTIVRARRM